MSFSIFLLALSSCIKPWQGRRQKPTEKTASIRIEREQIQFERIESVDAKAWQARAVIQLSFCIASEGTQPNVIQIKIEKEGGKASDWRSIPLASSQCVQLSDNLDFPYASHNSRFYRWIVLARRESEAKDQQATSTLFINPWTKSIAINTGDESLLTPRPIPPLQVHLDSVTLGRPSEAQLTVDRFLGLVVQYPILVKIAPQIRREASAQSSQDNPFSLTQTIYQIRGALISGNKVLGEFHSESSTDRSGQLLLHSTIPIPFDDLQRLETHPYFKLDLIPVSAGQDAPEGRSFEVTLDLLRPNEQLLPVIKTEALQDKGPSGVPQTETNESERPETRLLKSFQVQPLQKFEVGGDAEIVIDTELTLTSTEVRRALYSQFLEPAWLYRFSYLYSKEPFTFPGAQDSKSDFDRFQQHPEKFVDWFRFTVVDDVERIPVQTNLNGSALNLEAGVFKEARESNRAIDGRNTSSGIERGENRTVGVSALGSGHNWFWSHEGGEKHYTQQESSNHRDRLLEGGFSRHLKFQVDGLNVTLRGTFRRCMLLIFKPARRPRSSTNFLFCGLPDTGQRSESYFYVSKERNESPLAILAGGPNAGGTRFLRIFRGEHNLVRFQKAMRDATLAMDVRPSAFWIHPESENETFFQKYDDYDSFPGILEFEHFPENNRKTEKLESVVNLLAQALEKPPIAAVYPSELMAYFGLVQSQPGKVLSSIDGQSRFARLGELIIARDQETCRLYLDVLSELHLMMSADQKTREAQWLYDLAARLAPKCQSGSH